MKILWICRWFGDYRIPLYRRLDELSGGQFYMAYSRDAVSPRVHRKMKEALGDRAIDLSEKSLLKLGRQGSNFSNSGVEVILPSGLFSAIRRINPDVMISDGFFQWSLPAVLMSHARKMCLFYERTVYTERNCPRWRRLFRQFIGRKVDGFLINGSLTKEYLKELGFSHVPSVEGCMVADTQGLARSVDEFEGSKELRLSFGCEDEGLAYLFIGQLVERKGIRELLTAWETHIKRFPQDHLFVLGDGILKEELEARFGSDASVHLMGNIDYDEVYRFYAMADVFVMPTLEDNWSLVVPEAMACGKPVATTIYNGCHPELIREGKNGFVFDSKDQNSIVNVLARFHSCDLKALGACSRELVSQYTPDLTAERIYDFLRNL